MDNSFIINQVSYLQWVRRQSESKSGEVSVYITITCNGQKAQFNSFIRGQEKQWNAKKKCFNGNENEPINTKLRLITSTLQQIELQLSANSQEVTAKTIIESYKSKLDSKVVKSDKTPPFLKVLDAYLQRQNEYGSKHQTKKNHNTYRRHLVTFLKLSKKENIKCQDFDENMAAARRQKLQGRCRLVMLKDATLKRKNNNDAMLFFFLEFVLALFETADINSPEKVLL